MECHHPWQSRCGRRPRPSWMTTFVTSKRFGRNHISSWPLRTLLMPPMGGMLCCAPRLGCGRRRLHERPLLSMHTSVRGDHTVVQGDMLKIAYGFGELRSGTTRSWVVGTGEEHILRIKMIVEVGRHGTLAKTLGDVECERLRLALAMMSILWRIEQRLLCDYSQGLELKSQEPMPRNDGSRSRLQALTALNHIAGLAANIPPARRCWVQVGEDRVPDVVGAHLLELFEWRTPLGGVALMHKDEGLPLCHRGTDFTEAISRLEVTGREEDEDDS
mmetsp:Transcript_27399/g.83334  ORF Transcript_27399/g.83334 Transcript_27399/m.83334 type:complete len:274 (+) Transcript_27399:1340-2161(+)